jgi:hypothetical protein
VELDQVELDQVELDAAPSSTWSTPARPGPTAGLTIPCLQLPAFGVERQRSSKPVKFGEATMPELIVGGVQTSQSDPPVLTNYAIQHLMTSGMNDTAFGNAVMDLVTDGPALSHTMVPGDFTVASFTGYAQVTALTPGSTTFIADGQVQALLDKVATFTLTGLTTVQTIKGFIVSDTGGTHILQAAYFTTPIPLTIVGQAINVLAGYTLGQI